MSGNVPPGPHYLRSLPLFAKSKTHLHFFQQLTHPLRKTTGVYPCYSHSGTRRSSTPSGLHRGPLAASSSPATIPACLLTQSSSLPLLPTPAHGLIALSPRTPLNFPAPASRNSSIPASFSSTASLPSLAKNSVAASASRFSRNHAHHSKQKPNPSRSTSSTKTATSS